MSPSESKGDGASRRRCGETGAKLREKIIVQVLICSGLLHKKTARCFHRAEFKLRAAKCCDAITCNRDDVDRELQ